MVSDKNFFTGFIVTISIKVVFDWMAVMNSFLYFFLFTVNYIEKRK